MEAQFISGTTGEMVWTRILDTESGLELEFQFRNDENEVQVHQRWSEYDPFVLIAAQDIREP